jgi:hypothetical protein
MLAALVLALSPSEPGVLQLTVTLRESCEPVEVARLHEHASGPVAATVQLIACAKSGPALQRVRPGAAPEVISADFDGLSLPWVVVTGAQSGRYRLASLAVAEQFVSLCSSPVAAWSVASVHDVPLFFDGPGRSCYLWSAVRDGVVTLTGAKVCEGEPAPATRRVPLRRLYDRRGKARFSPVVIDCC